MVYFLWLTDLPEWPNRVQTVIDCIVSGLIKTDICDHFAVFSLLKINLEQANIKKAIIKRDINEDIMKYLIALTGTS